MRKIKVLPEQTEESLGVRTSKDRQMFIKGKEDAMLQLPRDNSVQSRDKECYDMGYNLGEVSI